MNKIYKNDHLCNGSFYCWFLFVQGLLEKFWVLPATLLPKITVKEKRQLQDFAEFIFSTLCSVLFLLMNSTEQSNLFPEVFFLVLWEKRKTESICRLPPCATKLSSENKRSCPYCLPIGWEASMMSALITTWTPWLNDPCQGEIITLPSS